MIVWYRTLLCYDAEHCLQEIGREGDKQSERGGEGRIQLVIIHHKAFSNRLMAKGHGGRGGEQESARAERHCSSCIT